MFEYIFREMFCVMLVENVLIFIIDFLIGDVKCFCVR